MSTSILKKTARDLLGAISIYSPSMSKLERATLIMGFTKMIQILQKDNEGK